MTNVPLARLALGMGGKEPLPMEKHEVCWSPAHDNVSRRPGAVFRVTVADDNQELVCPVCFVWRIADLEAELPITIVRIR